MFSPVDRATAQFSSLWAIAFSRWGQKKRLPRTSGRPCGNTTTPRTGREIFKRIGSKSVACRYPRSELSAQQFPHLGMDNLSAARDEGLSENLVIGVKSRPSVFHQVQQESRHVPGKHLAGML